MKFVSRMSGGLARDPLPLLGALLAGITGERDGTAGTAEELLQLLLLAVGQAFIG